MDLRYKLIWYLLSLLLLIIRAPLSACLLIVRSWYFVVPEGEILLPRNLKGKWNDSWVIVWGNFVAESMRVIVYKLLLNILGVPSGLNCQLMQYHAYFDVYNFPPEAWRRCYQLFTTDLTLLATVSNELLFQSFVYRHLSSTTPMILFYHCKGLSGLMIIQPLFFSPKFSS